MTGTRNTTSLIGELQRDGFMTKKAAAIHYFKIFNLPSSRNGQQLISSLQIKATHDRTLYFSLRKRPPRPAAGRGVVVLLVLMVHVSEGGERRDERLAYGGSRRQRVRQSDAASKGSE